ncbi:MAG: 1-acyl-sn-glycerol-3-phosphate acyltransferase [Pseudomonadota bacterium]|nr:1-acyl-sn-glycerol-3-phosphate acyltransferase [Pseudomonadota bacterium]
MLALSLRYPLYLIGKLTALAFIFFGGGVLATTITPLSLLIPGGRRDRIQFLMHLFFRCYLRMLQLLCLIRLEINGVEKLAKIEGRVVIANHPSLLDVVILMAIMPRVQCIVKHQLWSHKFLGSLMRAAGFIRNDLDPENLLAACKEAIEDGRSLIIFPEGTRTPVASPPRFNRSFANLALLMPAPIQPVVIRCTPPFLYKGEPLWRVPPRTPFLRVTAGDYLDAKSYLLYGQRGIAARKLVASLELYYEQQLAGDVS